MLRTKRPLIVYFPFCSFSTWLDERHVIQQMHYIGNRCSISLGLHYNIVEQFYNSESSSGDNYYKQSPIQNNTTLQLRGTKYKNLEIAHYASNIPHSFSFFPGHIFSGFIGERHIILQVSIMRM